MPAGSNQRWDHTGGQLRSRASGLCLTAHDGAQFTMESCTPGTRNQIWHLPLLPAAPR
ncbi:MULTISPECIES: ricin-type beta-trefoil lectin domain protein [unclassified Mesorhizobium]|uniref:ricin-type beta-trefoil lectin domain protein n=1 Tax=unclassified Mesorhizobium TaxID=325217 RepID=UPI0033380F6B